MKFFLFISTFFSIVLLAMHAVLLPDATASAAVCPTGVPEEYAHLEPGTVRSVYFLSWHGKYDYTPNRIEEIAHDVTDIMYAFIVPQEDGTCRLLHPKFAFGIGPRYEKERGHFQQLLDIKRRFPHLRILLSAGGGGAVQTFVNLYRKDLLKKCAKNFVEALDSYTFDYQYRVGDEKKTATFDYKNLFDGLDINWEFHARGVKAEYAQAYASFIKELRRLLNIRERKLGKKMMLTATLQISPAVYGALPLQEIARSVDWFHVMSYDVYGLGSKSVGHNTPICGPQGVYTIDGALNRIIRRGVSPDKLVLGISGYGYKYADNDGYGKSFNKTSKRTKALFYKDIDTYFVTHPGYERGWSEQGRVPYLYNKQAKTFISYDDAESVEYKVRLAAEKRCRGVMFWALSHDDQNHTLVKVISEHVGKPFFQDEFEEEISDQENSLELNFAA
jgi:chitinase